MQKIISIFILIMLVLVGCTQKSTSSSPSPSPTSSGGGHIDEKLTMNQAQEKVPFKILIPDHLPNGVVFQYAKVGNGATEYVSDAKGSSVMMMFADGAKGFSVVEQQGVMGHLDRELVKKVSVGNIAAEYANDEKQLENILLWQKDNVVCRIYTNGQSSFANEKGLIEIASSFK